MSLENPSTPLTDAQKLAQAQVALETTVRRVRVIRGPMGPSIEQMRPAAESKEYQKYMEREYGNLSN